ncbi:TPA: phosphoribosylglycinamide formyltransferase [candidate division WOR-3 bacterium]|jgi:phosphoribosylglycinamide formyltransferase-1|uniref:Phosphoribosylglycinamide formyltransferase n=1 Tax=candidate division WOR-3 bacterium TaxID=2052148 RepID=A0A350H8A8_UNCW3|nr:phosphoribosylglycinamide formyltransferase [candidate division WOR-3 bacterium]
MTKRIAIFISGRGSNMESLLKKSGKENLDADFIVVSDNERAEGLNIAKKLNIKTFVLKDCGGGSRLSREDSNKIKNILIDERIELVFLAGFMRIIPKDIIDSFPRMFVNIHPSLLPSFKGKDAQRQAFEYGVKLSGCTVHFVDSGIDSGPIILQRCIDISSAENPEDAGRMILEAEHQAYFEALKLLIFKKYTIDGRRVLFDT